VLEAPLDGGGGGSGHTVDPVSGEPRSASLALVRGTRGLVGRPHGSIRIHVVCLYVSLLGGDSGTGMTSTTSSTSMSPSSPSLSPSLRLGDDNTVCLGATG
jgi:hypothetical protein